MSENIISIPANSSTKVELLGGPGFRLLKVDIPPQKKVMAESGAMASMSAAIEVETTVNGDWLRVWLLKFLGHESFFINFFYNPTEIPQTLYLTQPTPGEIIEAHLNDETIYIQPGAFIAQSGGIKRRVVWAGFSSWITGEGLFRLEFSGRGRLWYGCYGAVVEKEIIGDYLVDTGHLLSYSPGLKLSVKLAGSLITSILNREGFLLKLSGNGKIQLQTRSVKGLAQWLNSRFWG